MNDRFLNLPEGRPHRKTRAAQTMLGFPIQEKTNDNDSKRRMKDMSNTNNSNRLVVPGAREAMDKFKMEAASEVGVNLKQG